MLPVPEVEVSGEAGEAQDESERFSLTPVTTENVGESPGVSVTTEEILESTPSVRVKQFGSYGSPSLLSVRGSDATHTLVLLDDIPLNDAASGLVDLSTVPSFLLQTVSVFRGIVPSVPSPYHPGGVVKFTTRKPPPGLHGEAYLKAGFFPFQGGGASGLDAGQETKPASSIFRFGALRQLILSSSMLGGSFGILASGGIEQGDGDFVYFNDNGTTYNTGDDSFRLRMNNGHTALSALLSLLWFPDMSSEVKLSFLEFDRSAGVPGLDVIQAAKTKLHSGRQYLSLSYNRFGQFADFPSFSAKAYFKSSLTGWMDPLGEISNARQDSESRNLGSGVSLSGARSLNQASTLLWGLSGGVERWDSGNVFLAGAPEEQKVLRLTAGWSFTEFVSLAGGRLELTGSLRSDFIGDQPIGTAAGGRQSNEYFLSPGAGVRLKPFGWLSLSFNVSYNHRPATLMELFGNQGVIIGNPELRSETSLSWDAGAVFDFTGVIPVDRLEIEYRYFDNRVDDLITFIQNSQRSMVAQNIGRASLRGLELILRLELLGAIKLQLGYTFLDPRDRSGIEPYEGRMLPNRPRHDMFLGGSVSRWSVTIGYKLDLLSGGFIDRASLDPIAERLIHSISVEWAPGFLKGFVLGMEIWNVGNFIMSEREVSSGDRTYLVREAVSDVDGYPLPGFGVYFFAGFKK